MTGQPDLSGEIHEDEEDEIVKIAREAADERGYAIYDDYEEYMKQRKRQEGLKLSNWDIKKQELKRVPAVKKNNVGCQYVYTYW